MSFSMFNTKIIVFKCFHIHMSKGKNITPNQRAMIKVLLDQNFSQVQIAKKLKLSRCAIQNAIKHINKFGMLENRGQPSINCQGYYNEMKAYPECSLSVSSIRRRLVEAGLNGRIARKKPLVSLKNRRARVAFAREHLTWSTADWTKVVFLMSQSSTALDQMGINMFGVILEQNLCQNIQFLPLNMEVAQ
uniref:HTH_Tnp_Tc3_2 domain-containing protein n=1 Tax=Heterorhabditis bacteriophora TaxID=37862 RepID=A0A1I7WK88_HETBA